MTVLNIFTRSRYAPYSDAGFVHENDQLSYVSAMRLREDEHFLRRITETLPKGLKSNTTPRGSYLDGLNPLTVTLGVQNVSFVAQTVGCRAVGFLYQGDKQVLDADVIVIVIAALLLGRAQHASGCRAKFCEQRAL